MQSQQKQYPPHLDMALVKDLTRLSRTSIYDFMKSRGFPKPLKLGARSLWRFDEVQAWLDANLEREGK